MSSSCKKHKGVSCLCLENHCAGCEHHMNKMEEKLVSLLTSTNKDCEQCHGNGNYMYDEIHSKFCEKCCDHSEVYNFRKENKKYLNGHCKKCGEKIRWRLSSLPEKNGSSPPRRRMMESSWSSRPSRSYAGSSFRS